MNENIIVPPPLHPLLADRNRGRGVQTQITEKTLIRVFLLGFFCNYIFLRFKGSKHLSGGGGATFYYYFFFFFFLGGGGGG